MKLPEYAKPVHTEGSEAVMSTPPWFDKYEREGRESRIATVFVDASAWPPKLVQHAMRTSAATRLPDGRWVCVARREGLWRLSWFANIRAKTPDKVEELPLEAPPLAAPDDDDDDPPDDAGPVAQLHAFAGKLIAIPFEGAAQVRDGDGPWREHAALKAKAFAHPRNVTIGGKPHFEWDGALYDADLARVDTLDCTRFFAAAGRVLALHDGTQLVEFGSELVPELAGHAITDIAPGPRETLILTFERDDERGTSYERAIYDPAVRTVRMLTEDAVGESPKVLVTTKAGDLVLFAESGHELARVTRAKLAELPAVAAADLPAPPRVELPILDEAGAASRALVSTVDDAIAMILGARLRLHTVDQPKAIVEPAQVLVATAASGSKIAALDGQGVLHTYSFEGARHESVPTVRSPRSLVAGLGGWIVAGADRVVVIGAKQTTPIEITGAVAAAADPESADLVIACEDRRLACWSAGELRDLPPPIEQIIAVAPLGERKFACAGTRGLYLLDLAMPELVRLEQRPRRPFIAGNGAGRLAYCPSASSVEVCELAGTKLERVAKSGVHYSSYSEPDDSEVTVHGLAFMDDSRVVIQLDAGRGNIVDPDTGSALKLDAQPGDARSRWIFITGQGILIAD